MRDSAMTSGHPAPHKPAEVGFESVTIVSQWGRDMNEGSRKSSTMTMGDSRAKGKEVGSSLLD